MNQIANSDMRILVVDDEESIRKSLSGFLDDYDYDVTSAPSAEKALELLMENSFHVAIVDLRLPGLSGDRMISEAHIIDNTLKFIIHTGSVTYRLSEELQKIGMKQDHVLYKPLKDLTVIVEILDTFSS